MGTSRIGYIHIDQYLPQTYGRVVQDELPGACQVNVTPANFTVPAAGQTITLTVDLVVGTRDLCPIFVADRMSPDRFLPSISSDMFVQSPTGPTLLRLDVPANPGLPRSTILDVIWGFRVIGNDVFTGHTVFVDVNQLRLAPAPVLGREPRERRE